MNKIFFFQNLLCEGLDGEGGSHLVSWEVVVKPVDLGGLGIGSLRLRNEALLAKWLWHFFMGSCSLWHEIIVSRYGPYPFDSGTMVVLIDYLKVLGKKLCVDFPPFLNFLNVL